MVWVRGDNEAALESGRPVPLVSTGEPCVYHRHAVRTLRAAGLDYEQVFLGPTMRSLGNAVAAGMGYMVATRRRASAVGMKVWENGPLPKPAPLHSAVYVREGGTREIYERLADQVAAVIHGPLDVQAQAFAAFGRVATASSAA
jgi:DNA-binding transcriptional LysR family regulator